MVEELAGRGAPLAGIRKLLPERRMRVLPGRLADDVTVAEALHTADPKVDPERWYCDHPLLRTPTARPTYSGATHRVVHPTEHPDSPGNDDRVPQEER